MNKVTLFHTKILDSKIIFKIVFFKLSKMNIVVFNNDMYQNLFRHIIHCSFKFIVILTQQNITFTRTKFMKRQKKLFKKCLI